MSCPTPDDYRVYVDWQNDDDFTDPNDDVTGLVLRDTPITYAYGRDGARVLLPLAAGSGGFDLCNVDRSLSPENTASPLFGFVEPGRWTQIERNTIPLFTARMDDFTIAADFTDRSAKISLVDGLGLLSKKLSTPLYETIRSGAVVNVILDEVGWPVAQRDIDLGASFFRYWWAEDVEAQQALVDVINSEGLPALAYIAPGNIFTFRDRHHRLLRTQSTTSQATFSAGSFDCTTIPAGTPIALSNPGLEVNTTGWFNSGGTFTRQTTQFHTGVASGRMVPSGVAATPIVGIAASVAPAATPGLYYKTSMWMFTTVAGVDVAPAIAWLDVADAIISTTVGDTVTLPTNQWTLISVTGLAPAITDTASPRFHMPGTPPVTDIVFVDDISFEHGQGLTYTAPFSYNHGWKDIVNQVVFEIQSRRPNPIGPEYVWEHDGPVVVPAGQRVYFTIRTDDPYVVPDLTDPDQQPVVWLSDTTANTVFGVESFNGQAFTFWLESVSNEMVQGLKVRLRLIPVIRTDVVDKEDSNSITSNGTKSYPNAAPWATIYDASAIADVALAYYATRRPTVTIRIVNGDAEHTEQIAERTISDRITVVNGEMVLSSDFHIERLENEIRALGKVHALTMLTEKAPDALSPGNVPFTFDVAGRGFDDGVFDVSGGLSNFTEVFIFDHPTQGQFDLGQFGY